MASCQSNGFSNSVLAIKLYFFYIYAVQTIKVAPPPPFLVFFLNWGKNLATLTF